MGGQDRSRRDASDGKWLLEGCAGAWWFADNDDYFGGRLREQDPLVSMQAHVSYTFRPR